VEIDLQMTRLAAQRSRRLAEIDQRGSYRGHGFLRPRSGSPPVAAGVVVVAA
jgi:hypothetical protein